MKMKSLLKAAAPALTAAGTVAYLVAPGRATGAQKAPFVDRNYAHRGLHRQDKSVPENSLEAFRAAVEHGYGVEMDVHLSADGALVVTIRLTASAACPAGSRTRRSKSCASFVCAEPTAASPRWPRRSRCWAGACR